MAVVAGEEPGMMRPGRRPRRGQLCTAGEAELRRVSRADVTSPDLGVTGRREGPAPGGRELPLILKCLVTTKQNIKFKPSLSSNKKCMQNDTLDGLRSDDSVLGRL